MPAPPPFGDQDYQQAMQRLLPRGRAWRSDIGAMLPTTLFALAPTYTRSTAAAAQLLVDTFVSTTLNLLPEWEASLGLPDDCALANPTLQARQAAVRAKWGERGGQNIAYFVEYAAALGYTITITEFAPSRFGQPFGLTFAGVAWAHAWQVTAPTFTIEYFEFGHDAFGEPFSSWTNNVLQCELQRLAPAQTVLLFDYGLPSLDLNFINGSAIDPRITYTGSGGTYFNSAGVLTAATTNAPRFGYDPVTHAALGLLIEESRTNGLVQSADVSNAGAWIVFGSLTRTPNAAVAPDGTLSAAAVGFTPGSGVYQFGAGPASAGQTYWGSIWARADASTSAHLVVTSNLGDAVIVPIAVSTVWQRFSGSKTMAVGTTAASLQVDSGTTTIYLWGGQLEFGGCPTSYIPTIGATVTRSADLAAMPVGSWFNPAAGTLASETFIPVFTPSAAQTHVEFNDGTVNNRLSYFSNSSAAFAVLNVGAGVTIWNANVGAGNPAAVVNKNALTYSAAGVSIDSNGGAITSNAGLAASPTFTTLAFGTRTPATAILNGYIRRIRYWPRAMAAAELQAATT